MIIRHGPTPYYHRVVEANGVLYLSGLTADDRSASLKGQTEQVLAKLEAVLAGLGGDRTKVLTATVYITDMDRKAEMNEAWTAWFGPEGLPARATIGVASLGEGILIEVVAIAVR
jgi:enamine deaminase RidA (YjgF/YER057c/UK114 family)